MDTNADHNLILRCREGDDEACRLLLARYEGYVYRLCYRFAGTREDALDLTQEALWKALVGLDGFQLNRPFQPWLRKVTVNVCLDALRRTQPKTVSLDQPIAEDLVLGDTLADRTQDPAAVAEWRDAREILQEAVSRLPPQYRLVLVLRHQEGLSYEEIAQTAGLPLGTVKTHLFRARRQLRQALVGVYGWEE
ncbi:MAG: RNA polymerase sigma factor [Bacillota bacterium]